MTKRGWLLMEHLNRFACRLLSNDYSRSYPDLLRSLNLSSIQDICIRRQLLLVYKYAHSLRNFPVDLKVPNVESVPYALRRRSHSMQLSIPNCTSIAALPLYMAFRVWNYFDVSQHSVQLGFLDFRLHIMHVSTCAYIYQRLTDAGFSKYFYSVDTL